MGYYTSYEITTEPSGELMRVMEALKDAFEVHYKPGQYPAKFIATFRPSAVSCEETKWYDHEKDMRFASGRCPDVLIHLRGEGSRNDDLWFKHFLNQKMQHCPAKITYNRYDPKKLK